MRPTLDDLQNILRFNEFQLDIIEQGMNAGLNYKIYADPKYSVEQMMEMYQGLKDKVDVKVYADPEIHFLQMYQIRKGLKKGINILKYCTKTFGHQAMQQVRLGAEHKLTPEQIKIFAKVCYNWKQMQELRNGLEAGIDVSSYANPKLSYQQMQEKRFELEREMR